jgi:hypothetical protein
MTLAGCAIDLAGHEPTTRDAIAPEPVHQSDAREAVTPALKSRPKMTRDVVTTSSAKQHKKAVAEGWSLASITGIPLPDSELLVPPPEPHCGAPESKADDPRQRDYEMQCYRAAEVFARSRLLLLQSSVEKMITAVTDTRQAIQEATSGTR